MKKLSLAAVAAAWLLFSCAPQAERSLPVTVNAAESAVAGSVPEIYFGFLSYKTGLVTILEFAANAKGNVAPLYRPTLKFAASGPYGIEPNGNFWSGMTKVTPGGHVLGSVDIVRSKWIVGPTAVDSRQNYYVVEGPGNIIKPVPLGSFVRHKGCPYTGAVYIDEYAPNPFGNPTPIRSIDLGNPACWYLSIAVDGSGNVFIAEEPIPGGQHAHVLEFSPTARGKAQPIRTIDVSCPSGTTVPPDIENLRVDAAGNLFGERGCSSKGAGSVVMYAPGSDIPRAILGSTSPYGFTIDGNDDIIAVVLVNHNFTIQEFKRDALKPYAILAGSKTGLSTPEIFPIGINSRQ